jgi:hypothetical protein
MVLRMRQQLASEASIASSSLDRQWVQQRIVSKLCSPTLPTSTGAKKRAFPGVLLR